MVRCGIAARNSEAQWQRRAWQWRVRRAHRGIAQRRAFPQARIHIAGCRHPDSPPGAAPGRPADLGAALAANHKIAIFKMYSNAIANPQNKTCRRPGCSTGSRRNQVTTQKSRLWYSKRVRTPHKTVSQQTLVWGSGLPAPKALACENLKGDFEISTPIFKLT